MRLLRDIPRSRGVCISLLDVCSLPPTPGAPLLPVPCPHVAPHIWPHQTPRAEEHRGDVPACPELQPARASSRHAGFAFWALPVHVLGPLFCSLLSYKLRTSSLSCMHHDILCNCFVPNLWLVLSVVYGKTFPVLSD